MQLERRRRAPHGVISDDAAYPCYDFSNASVLIISTESMSSEKQSAQTMCGARRCSSDVQRQARDLTAEAS